MKTWKRCKSFYTKLRSPAEDGDRKKLRRVAPVGCVSVYVGGDGEEKQRFVVKTEHVNHPLFKMLLEEAELEYGYNSEGPLKLPCNVDFFVKVLVEMDSDDGGGGGSGFILRGRGCGFPLSPAAAGRYHPLLPLPQSY